MNSEDQKTVDDPITYNEAMLAEAILIRNFVLWVVILLLLAFGDAFGGYLLFS